MTLHAKPKPIKYGLSWPQYLLAGLIVVLCTFQMVRPVNPVECRLCQVDHQMKSKLGGQLKLAKSKLAKLAKMLV